MPENDGPHSREELRRAFAALHAEASELFEAFAAEDFFRRPGEGKWSPAEHVVHLVKSVQAVAMAMRLPKLLLRWRFGRAKGSRRYGEVREVYRARLAEGAVARGRYVPGPLAHGGPGEAAAARSRALAGWKRAAGNLERALGRWSEAALDAHRLPHPLLGKLTVREMLFFTHYHDRHHLDIVRRSPGASPPPAAA